MESNALNMCEGRSIEKGNPSTISLDSRKYLGKCVGGTKGQCPGSSMDCTELAQTQEKNKICTIGDMISWNEGKEVASTSKGDDL